jgi:hypothetical protein
MLFTPFSLIVLLVNANPRGFLDLPLELVSCHSPGAYLLLLLRNITIHSVILATLVP